MNDEIQKWFTEHGAVLSAEQIEDRNDKTNLSGLIKYTFADGAVLTIRPPEYKDGVEVRPQEIVGRELPKPKDEKPAAQSQAAAPGGEPWKDDGAEAGSTGRRWGWNPETRLYDRDLGPSPYAQGLTGPQQAQAAKDAEAKNPSDKQVTGSDGKVYTIRSVPGASGAPPTVKVFAPDGTEVPGGVVPGAAKEPEKPEAADRVGKPTGRTETVQQNGRTVKRTEYVLPDGTPEWREQTETGPATPNKTVTKPDGRTYEQVVDPETGRVVEERLVPTTGTKPIPEGATGWTPDPLKPAYGLTERAREVAAMIERGEIDQQQAAQLIAQDRIATELVAQQATNTLTTQQNIRQQDASLSNAATTFSGNMIQTGAQTMLSKSGMNTGGTGSAGEAFLALLNIASQYARQNGGLMDRRDPLAPALQQVNQQALPGTGGGVTINVGGQPTVAPQAPPQQPAIAAPIFGPPPQIPGQTPVPGPAGEPPAVSQALFQPPQMAGGAGMGGALFDDDDIASVLDADVAGLPGLGLVRRPTLA